MNEREFRDLLIKRTNGSANDDVIDKIISLGYAPKRFTQCSVEQWEMTFVGQFLLKYVRCHGEIKRIERVLGKIPEITDLTEENLRRIVADLKDDESLSPNSKRTYSAHIKSAISGLTKFHELSGMLPCPWYSDILSGFKGCPTTKPFLNKSDIKKLLEYKPENERERVCLARYIIQNLAALRYSDVCSLSESNIQDNIMTVVPKKTKSHGTVVSIPVADRVSECIAISNQSKHKYGTPVINKVVKEIAEKCGITEMVTYMRGGKMLTKRKCDAITSHTGRVSSATNLHESGMNIVDICKFLGHTSPTMTYRYIATTDVKLTKEANDFINMKF